MTILFSGKDITVGNREVHNHIYLDHEIQISRDNQTCELQKIITISWTAYGKLKAIFRCDLPTCLDRKVLISMCYRFLLMELMTVVSTKKFIITQRRLVRSLLAVSLPDHVINGDLFKMTRDHRCYLTDDRT